MTLVHAELAISTRLFTGPEHRGSPLATNRTGRRTRAGGYERRVERRGKTSGGSQAWKISFIETLFLRVSAGPQSTYAEHAPRAAQVPPPIGYEPVLWSTTPGSYAGVCEGVCEPARGRSNEKIDPTPGRERTSNRPFMSVTSSRQMYSPRPLPPIPRDILASRR